MEKEKEQIILPLLPLRDIVLFPHRLVPLFIGREKSIMAIEHAMASGKEIFLAAQKDAQLDDPDEKDIYRIGTIGTIIQILRLPDGTVKALIEGKQRARIVKFVPGYNFFMVQVEPKAEVVEAGPEIEALVRLCHQAFEEYTKINKKIPPEAVSSILNLRDPARLSDHIAAVLNLKLPQKQRLLEMTNVNKRLELVYGYLRGEMEVTRLEQRIKERVKKQMEKTQRDYYLNEQMRAIQKEMGEREDGRGDLAELEKRIKRKRLPREAAAKVRQEFKKLQMMSPMSAEATVVRNYIDWILSIPWYERTQDKIDIEEAEAILEADHYGLEKPKQRILEHLAVQKLVKKIKGPILCLVGPPGVGKTSLARSVARAMGRHFVRISLGGVRDEAEIRGHRRTYIGALPGKIIQGMRKAGTINPVFCLDEVDKIGTDFRGDPAAALLEVLDPEQNCAFQDHYLELAYDLSNVLFITTANALHTIPIPLLDRMEIIEIPGYTEEEKLEIAKGYLIPRQLEAHGLKPEQVKFSDRAILEIIRRYTREAGVRNLEREIATICRKIAKEVARDPKAFKPTKVSVSKIPRFLGVPRYRYGMAEKSNEIGMATGLAWTETGGALLQIEAVIMPGKGKLLITGKLGEVMQESVQAAMSYVRSRAHQLGLPPDFYQRIDIHVHVPEGAIPKDGPSAGITMATAIVSALLKIPVKSTVAMTGEITLRGRVLPIGGLKEKLLAARRGNIETVIIPKENEKDLKEIPAKILKDLDVVLVDHMDEVLKLALELESPDKLFRDVPPFSLFGKVESGDEIRAH